ncbi:MAG: hypothetical protein RJB13_447 [Pseudomonadota bacterium]
MTSGRGLKSPAARISLVVIFWAFLNSLVTGCGPRSSSKQRLSPDAAFEKLKPTAGNPILCGWATQYGCGYLSASSATANKKFDSANFLVQCSATSTGYSIALRDRVGIGFGSGLVLQMYGVREFSEKSLVCGDLKTKVVSSQLIFEDGTCSVGLHFGDDEMWSQNEAPCSVTLEKRDGKNAGVIDCPQLINAQSTWTFDNPAVFTCP